MSLCPKEAGKLIAELSSYIKIKEEGVRKLGDVLVEEINSGRLSPEHFSQSEYHPKPEDSWALDWLFVVDTLNFCFWHTENQEGWMVEGKSGYFALCTAINRAIKENVDILNPNFYSTITKEQLLKILRSDTKVDISLISERVECLHEVGQCLLKNFDGSFMNCVKQANNSAVELLKIITNNFKCFRDETTYREHKVSILKRAQILIADIWSCYKNADLGYFKDIKELTMFADYRVPQSLLYFGVLEYSNELMEVLKKDTVLEYGDAMEVEIRGCSIQAVTLLEEHVKEKIADDKRVNSIVIDHFLWDFRRKHNADIAKRKLPFHKTFCIYY